MTNERINQLANEVMESVYTEDDVDYAIARVAIERAITAAVSEAEHKERETCEGICAKDAEEYGACAERCADDESRVDEWEQFRHWATAAASLAWKIRARAAADKERG